MTPLIDTGAARHANLPPETIRTRADDYVIVASRVHHRAPGLPTNLNRRHISTPMPDCFAPANPRDADAPLGLSRQEHDSAAAASWLASRSSGSLAHD